MSLKSRRAIDIEVRDEEKGEDDTQQERVCRAAYHYRAQRSCDFKDGLSLIVDGCDFSLFGLPHFNCFDKISSQGWKLKVSLFKVHSPFIIAR